MSNNCSQREYLKGSQVISEEYDFFGSGEIVHFAKFGAQG